MNYANRLFIICFFFLIIGNLQGCATYKAATNTFDDSQLTETDSATLFTQNYAKVFAYKKRGLGAEEDAVGNLDWKTKLPAGRYRLAVSFDKPGVGKSFVPVSLTLVAEAGKKYWVAYDESHGFLNNSWRPTIVNSEPPGFYGLLEFWKK